MPLKVHMLHDHLEELKDDTKAYSNEQGKRIHEDVVYFERFYQGQSNEIDGGLYLRIIRENSFCVLLNIFIYSVSSVVCFK